jgi:sigma-B regulation protein RsbU (phosphoserine phosphatase)
LITGTGILIYPFAPLEWQKLLYDEYMQDDASVRIYPFAFFSRNEAWTLSATIEKASADSNANRITKISTLFGDKKFVVGRVFFPVAGEEKGENPFLAMDIYQKSDIFSVNQTVLNIMLVLAGFFLLVEIFVIKRLNKFGTEINDIIVQKFDILKSGIRQISSGNLDYKLKMGGEDEFVELAGRFNEMGDKLKSTIDEVREKDRLDHELKIASQVQMSLLPSQLPRISGYRVAASINTANEIGGDFYDIAPLLEDTYLFSIGDVSGKGSSAAFYMAQFISLLRFTPQFTNKPAEIAQRLNSYFSSEVKDRQIFVTSVIGVLDAKKHTVKFVRTGHTPPVLIPGSREKEIREISSDGLGIGLTKTGTTFKNALREKTVRLAQGDIILLYTDGVVEAATGLESETSTIFGEERLMEILRQLRGHSAQEIVSKVTGELKSFYQDQMPVDDYTLFVIQRIKGD